MEDHPERLLVAGVLLRQGDRLHEQLRQRRSEPVQHELDLLPQLLRLELDGVLLEDGVGGLQDTVDDVEVSAGELGDHVGDEVGPPGGEVLLADDGDGLAQLLLDRAGALQHQVHDQALHLEGGSGRIEG